MSDIERYLPRFTAEMQRQTRGISSNRGVSLMMEQQAMAAGLRNAWNPGAWKCNRCGATGSLAGHGVEVNLPPKELRNLTEDDLLAYTEADHALTGCNGRLEFDKP